MELFICCLCVVQRKISFPFENTKFYLDQQRDVARKYFSTICFVFKCGKIVLKIHFPNFGSKKLKLGGISFNKILVIFKQCGHHLSTGIQRLRYWSNATQFRVLTL